jgi:hypothetical protein
MNEAVLRLSTLFASMMAGSAFALALAIGIAGTAERTGAACIGCASAIAAAFGKPSAPILARTSPNIGITLARL